METSTDNQTQDNKHHLSTNSYNVFKEVHGMIHVLSLFDLCIASLFVPSIMPSINRISVVFGADLLVNARSFVRPVFFYGKKLQVNTVSRWGASQLGSSNSVVTPSTFFFPGIFFSGDDISPAISVTKK